MEFDRVPAFMLNRRLLTRITIAWIVILIAFTLQPWRVPGTTGRTFQHAVEHIVTFGATALLMLALARNREEEWQAVLAAVGLAAGIETAQFLIYSLPEFEWWDIREDAIGIALAMLMNRTTGVRRTILAETTR